MILMHTLPLYERQAVDATQAMNVDPSGENVTRLLEAASAYHAHVQLTQFIVRILDETDA